LFCRSAFLSATPFLFVSPSSLFQTPDSVTKGLLPTGSLSRLCSCWWLVRFGERECWRWMFTVAERRAALLHTSPTDQMCGWLDRRLPSSYFISTLAVSSVAAMVGRLAPLKVSVFCFFFTILWPPFLFLHLLCDALLLAAERKGEWGDWLWEKWETTENGRGRGHWRGRRVRVLASWCGFGSLVFQKGGGRPASIGIEGKIAGAKIRVLAERSLSSFFFSKEGKVANLYQRNRF